ncbi:LLM class flavin-dependent oxidoreductase [Gordonia sp. ABSL11-1]|uniref:LLM class flavin-dependent oxidoreductase n=1 Tax=Gordonia sp. ABSL11-1 TaxID=3053924 RepID=UPI002573F3F6|nr:LLM class flavin-dependent oxidoreductase [Gordonia sp. ABSL11-1]MDL9945062.1 LLM class flavin-dependent oxidoreductase [Gordonia sp. ABSL11-1]
MSVFIEIAVGELPGQVSLDAAAAIARAAEDAGAAGLVIRDSVDGVRGTDPSVVGSYLAGRHAALAFVVEAPTTHNAPYNLARRVLSFDRATGGRVGVLLRPGDGDEVTDVANAPPHESLAESDRWVEYVRILNGLWESFPASALRGDQGNAVVADDTHIRPIDHDGDFYRVAGPLDGPSSPQGRPAVLANDPSALGWDRVARYADAVIVDEEQVSTADLELAAAAERADRRRDDIALLARTSSPASTRDSAPVHATDGVTLLVTEFDDTTADLIRAATDRYPHTPDSVTLRALLGLREIAGATR